MSHEILKIINDFKDKKIAVSKIEADLGFSNGLLGKVARGDTGLSSEKLKKLTDYHLEHFPIQPSTTEETNKKINEIFGAGTIMRWGDKPDTGYEVISTGSLLLDSALGIGGLPRALSSKSEPVEITS